jgi:hypothetical protein
MNDFSTLDRPPRIAALAARSTPPARRMIPVLEWTIDIETGRPGQPMGGL